MGRVDANHRASDSGGSTRGRVRRLGPHARRGRADLGPRRVRHRGHRLQRARHAGRQRRREGQEARASLTYRPSSTRSAATTRSAPLALRSASSTICSTREGTEHRHADRHRGLVKPTKRGRHVPSIPHVRQRSSLRGLIPFAHRVAKLRTSRAAPRVIVPSGRAVRPARRTTWSLDSRRRPDVA